MTLSIIGSGFGRTGTKSLKEALERLGFGPCHHMYEILEHPHQVPHWQAIARNEPPDWETVFAGYQSQVDWPGAYFWRELADAFPEAKVIHTERPEERWWASFSVSIARLMRVYREMSIPPHAKAILDVWDELPGQQVFDGRLDDRETALAAYRKHNEDVRATIPPERLLVFDVAEGWGPLCRFLEVPAPDEPFPHRNLRADFWEALGGEPTAA